jgi:hypothetical protein
MLTTSPATGAAPADQLVPTVQSVLVVPVQATWAAADPADRVVSAVAEALAMRKRSNRVLGLPDDR